MLTSSCRHSSGRRQHPSESQDFAEIAEHSQSSENGLSNGCRDDEPGVDEEETITESKREKPKLAKARKQSKSTKGRQNFVRIDRKVRSRGLKLLPVTYMQEKMDGDLMFFNGAFRQST